MSLGTLTASGIVVSRGPQTILDGIDLVVAPGHRIGVVGPNGSGKTTLLRALAGDVRTDRGAVTATPPGLTIGHMTQESRPAPGETVHAALARQTGVAEAAVRLETAAEALAGGGSAEQYQAALDRYLALGAADFDTRIEEVVDRIGLGPASLDLPFADLSGGQQARARLAAVLLSRFDVLLLDEPTNDLDFPGLGLLEDFVTRLPGGAVIVSHDRRFLDRTVATVLELDAHTHRGTIYNGGWAAYVEAREVAGRHAAERYEAFVRQREELEDRMRTQRQWASVGVSKTKRKPRDNDKAQRDFFLNNTERLAAKVRITEKRLERLETERVDKPWEPWVLHMRFGSSGRSGDVVARLDRAVVERGGWRLGPVDLEIRWADRVAITGANGSGKSTLLAALLGNVTLAAGASHLGPAVVVGTLDQPRAAMPPSARVLDAFIAATGSTVSDARALLAKFGLGAAHVTRSAESLSPGERTRAVLAVLATSSVNLLVLDEPTNHLDLPAIEELEGALDAYDGTLLLVTHDRELLANVTTTRVLRVADGLVTDAAAPVT